MNYCGYTREIVEKPVARVDCLRLLPRGSFGSWRCFDEWRRRISSSALLFADYRHHLCMMIVHSGSLSFESSHIRSIFPPQRTIWNNHRSVTVNEDNSIFYNSQGFKLKSHFGSHCSPFGQPCGCNLIEPWTYSFAMWRAIFRSCHKTYPFDRNSQKGEAESYFHHYPYCRSSSIV